MENFQITDQPKVSVSGFPSVDRNGISASAIMKKLKKGHNFINMDHMEKFQITDHPKVWVSSFPSVDGNGISMSAIMKKLKNGCHFVNIDLTENFKLPHESPTCSFTLPDIWLKCLNNNFFSNVHKFDKLHIQNQLYNLNLLVQTFS